LTLLDEAEVLVRMKRYQDSFTR